MQIKIKKITCISAIFLLFGNTLIAQDTVFVEDRIDFEDIVLSSFHDYTASLTKKIRRQIKCLSRKYNFENERSHHIYKSFYMLKFDSCGYIIDCEPIVVSENEELISYQEHIANIIVKSNWRIKNKAIDYEFSHYSANFLSVLCTFNVVVRTRKVEFIEDNNSINNGTVFAFNGSQGFVYFDGFNYGCDH